MKNTVKRRAKIKNANCYSRCRHFEFLFPDQLAKMSGNDHVLVDSSTICAIVLNHAFSSVAETATIIKRMKTRMSPSRGNDRNTIFFREYIDMTIIEVVSLFGDIEKVPVGIVKKARKR